MTQRMPRKIIRNFQDFLDYHSDQSPIYYYKKRLYAGYNLQLGIEYRYRFEEPSMQTLVEKSIAENLSLFASYSMPYFFYPGSTEERDLPGKILYVKKGRRNNDSISRSQIQDS